VLQAAKFAVLGAISGLLLTGVVPAANAEIMTYSWTGVCDDAAPPAGCGSGLAHAVIQVQDYTPGDEFQLSNMVSFFYVSSKYSSGFTPQFGFFIAAGRFQDVPPGTPFATDLTFLFWDNATHTSQSIFETFSFFNDFWCFNACGHDVGNSSTFVQVGNAAVPEPSALVLLGAGLVWLSVARRRGGKS